MQQVLDTYLDETADFAMKFPSITRFLESMSLPPNHENAANFVINKTLYGF